MQRSEWSWEQLQAWWFAGDVTDMEFIREAYKLGHCADAVKMVRNARAVQREYPL